MPAIFSSSRVEPVGAVDPGVGADPELAEEARAGVGGERRLEVLLAALGASADHLAVRERQLDALDLRRRAGSTER